MRPQSNIVLPLPASPLIQNSRDWSSASQRLKSEWSRIHLYESFNKPPFLSSMRRLSSLGSVQLERRSAKHPPAAFWDSEMLRMLHAILSSCFPLDPSPSLSGC